MECREILKSKANMRYYFSCFFFFTVAVVFSQDKVSLEKAPDVKIDSLYREDQFYIAFTYNRLLNKPEGLDQNKLSTGVSVGFLRDMPINKSRTVAIASGLGFRYNSYNQNLVITEDNDTPEYAIADYRKDFEKNKFSQLIVELPVEFRWRTSTPESYKFWRIYGGLKFSYLLYDRSTFIGDSGKIIVTNNRDFGNFLYGAYISSGYNTWNIYAYYGLNSVFKTAKINGESIDMSVLNIGVIFYIL
jgi:hypothetical protein